MPVFPLLYLSAVSAYVHVCRRLFSTTMALSFDGWSFSLACSCLMNPTVHVLIECFLYGLKFAPQPPPASHCRRAPPPLPLVCEAAHWWLMNKGSLVAHFPYESSGLCKQTAVQKPHTWQHTAHQTRRGKWKQRHFPIKLLFGCFCIFDSGGKKSIVWWGGIIGNAKVCG